MERYSCEIRSTGIQSTGLQASSITVNIASALSRFTLWIFLLAFVESQSPAAQFYLIPAWAAVFLTIHGLYAYKFGDNRQYERAVSLRRPTNMLLVMGAIPIVLALCTPWAFALQFGFCLDKVLAAKLPVTLTFGPPGWSFGAGLAHLLLAIVPYAFWEEFTFRRWLLAPLALRFGHHRAVFVTSFLFAALHLQPGVFAWRLMFGIFAGYLALASGSIWPGILCHWAFDAVIQLFYHGRPGFLFKDALTTPLFACSTTVIIALSSYALLGFLIFRAAKIRGLRWGDLA